MPTTKLYRPALNIAAIVLLLVASTTSFAQLSDLEILPSGEMSDGCTLIPDGHIRDCCLVHDQEYFVGGTYKERRESDKRLYNCVRKKKGLGHKLAAPFIWLGVRIGGVPFFSTPFRWGFGKLKKPKKDGAVPEPTPTPTPGCPL
jgi:hypothetical protein